MPEPKIPAVSKSLGAEDLGGAVAAPVAGPYFVSLLPGGTINMPTSLQLFTNTLVSGVGRDVTVLKLASGVPFHAVWGTDIENVLVRDLTIDASAQAGNSGAHALRLQRAKNVRFQNVRFVGSAHYGIGLQGGPFEDLTFDNCIVDSTGADGIDIKGPAVRVRISNTTIRSPGKRVQTDQVGIDVRGEVMLSNVAVLGLPIGVSGIRFRTAGSWGVGGDKSVLSCFQVVGQQTGVAGVDIQSPHVVVANGYCERLQYGVRIDAEAQRCVVSSVIARNDNAGVGFTAGRWTASNRFVGCVASGMVTPWLLEGSGNTWT